MSEQINPFEIGQTYTVFNPTPKTRITMFDGKEITIKPFGKFETAHKIVHDHLISNTNNKNYGLVSFTYDGEARKLHATEAEFQKAQSILGLVHMQTFLEECIHHETVAEQSNKIQKVPSFLKSNLDKFKKELASVQELTTTYMRGADESRRDKGQSETEAGRDSGKTVVRSGTK